MVGDILQPTHLLFVLVVALLVLGPKRLPEVGRALGRGLRDFRSAISGEEHSEPTISAPEPPKAPEQPSPTPAPGEQPSESAPDTAPSEPTADTHPTQVQKPDAPDERVEAVTSGRSDSNS